MIFSWKRKLQAFFCALFCVTMSHFVVKLYFSEYQSRFICNIESDKRLLVVKIQLGECLFIVRIPP